MRICREPNVVKRPVRIVAGDKNRSATKIAGVLGRVSKCIHRPRSVFGVWSKIMDARLAGWNGRISLLDGGRLRSAQNIAAGKLPVFVALRSWIDEFVGPRIFRVAVVNDDADILRGGSDANVDVGAESVAAGHLHRSAVEIGGVLGRVAKCVDRPAQVVAIRAEIMNAHMPGGNGRWRLRFQRTSCTQQEKTKNRKEGNGAALHGSHSRVDWRVDFFADITIRNASERVEDIPAFVYWRAAHNSAGRRSCLERIRGGFLED